MQWWFWLQHHFVDKTMNCNHNCHSRNSWGSRQWVQNSAQCWGMLLAVWRWLMAVWHWWWYSYFGIKLEYFCVGCTQGVVLLPKTLHTMSLTLIYWLFIIYWLLFCCPKGFFSAFSSPWILSVQRYVLTKYNLLYILTRRYT